MNPITRSILSEYKFNYNLYNDFCFAMHTMMDDILKKDKYKCHISSRLKELSSLSEKIHRKKNQGVEYRHIEDIEDIVGVRIIFYTEMDRKKFLRRLTKEFDGSIDIRGIKKTKGSNGYSSVHAVASFGEKRLQLSEYNRFKGLKCEIQLTLMLEHAWAEVEHDILYKVDPKISHIDPKQYQSIKKRMQKIMSEYIHRASSEMESIIQEIKKIKITKR